MDYALSTPIPWKARDCFRAATVDLGGRFDEIAASERLVRSGQNTDRPFVLLAQPTSFDPSRAPAGKHIALGLLAVPGMVEDEHLTQSNTKSNASPGFSETGAPRSTFSPANLETHGRKSRWRRHQRRVMDFRHFLLGVHLGKTTPHPQKTFTICSGCTQPRLRRSARDVRISCRENRAERDATQFDPRLRAGRNWKRNWMAGR